MKSTLFVGDLSTSCTEKDLEEVFGMVAPVRHVRMQRAQNTQASLGYGFVKMSSPLAAYKAMSTLNGVLLCGRKLRIKFAVYRMGTNPDDKQQPTNCLHVKFIGLIPGATTNEETIRELYSPFGGVEDVNIRKISLEKRKNICKGYGFIQFAEDNNGTMSAIHVINVASILCVGNISYTIEVSKELQKHLSDSGLIKHIVVQLNSLDKNFHNHNKSWVSGVTLNNLSN